MQVSVVIITLNEEAHIADAIRSVSWADEVLVVDSESSDRTQEIATELGARVIVEKWRGFAAQKQFAVDQASHDRILSLDADEVISPELSAELRDICNSPTICDGYRIPRLSVYMGREIWHSGWYPDWQLRFFDRRKAKWKQVAIHESVEMATGATASKLNGNIIHHSIESAEHHGRMIQTRYAPLSARAMFESGRRTSPLRIATSPAIAFVQTYILKGGFLDGFPGVCIAYFAAYNVFLKHAMLYEMRSGTRSAAPDQATDNQN